MIRREFVCCLGFAAALPFIALAQSRSLPVVGIIRPEPLPSPSYDAFQKALRDLGYIEGQTIVLEPRWPEGRQLDDYLAIAKSFVQRRVDIIVAGHSLSTLAAKQATQTIPIVFASIGLDPIEFGLAKSLARPGYNITGMTLQTNELPGKRLELIRQIVPTASRIAILLPDNDTTRRMATDHEAPASLLGVQLLRLEVSDPRDFETAFDKARRGNAAAMVLVQNALFYANPKPIADLSLKYRLPVLSGDSGFARAGGLINHGPDPADLWRRSASLVDKILKGAKPGDLPIEQPIKFEVVVNLKTAKALGVSIPPAVLVQADEVIE
jgi:putative tryptophan/tyrosine transport system substrate-binding protein